MSMKDTLLPFKVIAEQLTILTELYTLDLASRTPPVIRPTESPSQNDTEVFYGDQEEPKSLADRMKSLLAPDPEEEV